MKLFLQILVPILAYLGIGAMGAKDKDDWKYIIFLPFYLVIFLGIFTLIVFFLKWLYA
jgi:hypothetical protein